MKHEFSLKQEDFDALLDWFSPNREDAGRQYERIRIGLIKFFRFRGCDEPETLADDTLNRVAARVGTLDDPGNLQTITFFYGFATNVYL